MEKAKCSKVSICIFFTLLLVLSGLWLHVFGISENGQPPSKQSRKLIRIELDTPDSFDALRDMHLDHATRSLKNGAYVIVTGEELREIERRGYSYEILIDDPSKIRIDPEYRDYEETIAYLDSLTQRYPDITHLEQVGVSQEYALPIWGLKISDNPVVEEDEPEILYTGTTHAREPLGNEICLRIATTLLEGYGVDPDMTTFVDEEEIWVVSIVNTEGFKYMMDNNLSDPWWRKNLRDNNESGFFEEEFDGVDLNRNYDFNWAMGGSGDPTSWVYRGPFPFSESETQAIRDLATGDHRFIFSISYHSWGEVIIWPWSWPGHPAPDEDVISEMAEEMASRIPRRSGFGTYRQEPSDALGGYSENWLYGVSGSMDFLIETCNEFIPAGTVIDSIVDANLPAAFYLLERALVGPGVTGHVTESQTGLPLEATVFVIDRDTDDIVPRTSEPNYGRYFRMLPPGEYDISFDLDGYGGIIEHVTINPDTLTVLDVELAITVDIELAQADVDDDSIGQSNGNGDGILNPGETIELTAWLENVGFLTAYGVTGTLSTQDTLVTLIAGQANYGDIAAGEIIAGDSPFVFSLSDSAQYGNLISLELVVVDDSSNTWNFDLDYTIRAANIDFQSMVIDDSEGGNGNGFPEAGEIVDIIMALRNTGVAPASEVWADISTSNPFLSIMVDSSYYGDLEEGQIGLSVPPYTIAISPDVDDTSTATIMLGIHAVDYYEVEAVQLHFGSVGIYDNKPPSLELPRSWALAQNYPNPFNPSTTISFDIPATDGDAQSLSLTVYDIRGRCVRKLLDSDFEPGRHKIHWDGRNDRGESVSSGIYLYRLKAGREIFTRKMTVLK